MRDTKRLGMVELRTLTDSDLVSLAKDKDSGAFGELVNRYQSRIYRLARRLTDNQEDAEDVLQEAFIRAFRAIGNFKGESKFSTWLFRITVNYAAMKRRAERINVESLDEPIRTSDGDIARDIEAPTEDPLETLVAKEIGEHLDRAISTLSPTNRAVFVLRHVEGLSTEETRAILGISIPAIKSRLHRTRLALQQQLLRLIREDAEVVCAA
jgi:RNA polymerase sigma-70 factor (ECF subfamily)